jgi:hypothetical protein
MENRGNFGAYFSLDESRRSTTAEVKDAEAATGSDGGGIAMMANSSTYRGYDSLDTAASQMVKGLLPANVDDEVDDTPAALTLTFLGRLPAVLVSMLLVLFQVRHFVTGLSRIALYPSHDPLFPCRRLVLVASASLGRGCGQKRSPIP